MHDDLDLVRQQLRITCTDAIERMTDLLDDALIDPDRNRMLEHLEGCQACAVYLDQLRSTITVLGSIAGADEYVITPATMTQILTAFRDNRQT